MMYTVCVPCVLFVLCSRRPRLLRGLLLARRGGAHARLFLRLPRQRARSPRRRRPSPVRSSARSLTPPFEARDLFDVIDRL